MSSGAVPSASDLVRGLSLLTGRLRTAPEKAPLLALRERLVGELLGDWQRAAAPLAADFRLVTHVGGAVSTMDREALEGTLWALAEQQDHLSWAELEDLVSNDEMVAGHGELCSMSSQDAQDVGADGHGMVSVSRMPFAFFVRCEGGLMTSETVMVLVDEVEVLQFEGTMESARAGLSEAVDAVLGSSDLA